MAGQRIFSVIYNFL